MTFAARTLAANGGGSSTKYTGTITQGFYYDGSFLTYYGFDTSIATPDTFGSRSPTTISGKTFASLLDYWIGSTGYTAYLYLSGLSGDPGADFITSVTVGSVTQYPVAGSYYYDSGTNTAAWVFPSVFGMGASGTVSCTITGV